MPPSKTKTRSAGATPFWIVFLPFAFGHYVSFFYRSVNAVLAPPLTAALHLSATQLGLLSSTYFLAFALAQLPVGLALDRYGPRRVQRVLLCVAAIGALLFAHGRSVAALCMARALIGLGVSACFMGAIKAVSYWVEPRRLPSIHSYLIAVGGCGAMSATLPVETLLYAIGWRGLFVVLALATLTAAGIIHCCAPREPAPDTARASTAARPTLRSLLDVYRHPAFRRTTALLLMPHAVAFGLQGLWIGQWLRDAGGLSDDAVAKLLCVGMAAIVVGSLSVGALTEWAGRFGIEPLDVGGIGTALFVLVQVLAMSGAVPLMPALSVAFTLCGTVAGLEYTIVAQNVPPALTGRAATCLNLLILCGAFAMQTLFGLVVGHWAPGPAHRYPAAAYRAAFAVMIALQMPGLAAWALRRARGLRKKRNAFQATRGTTS